MRLEACPFATSSSLPLSCVATFNDLMPFLELQNLQKKYPDGTQAVKGVDLSIDEGEFIVLLGPSGCGKTTTLRMVAGLEDPTAGQILLNDRNITHLPPSQRDVGFVFQFYALYPHMTVWQNIAFPLENTGLSVSEIDATINRVSNALGIASLLKRHPGRLSGGDQQRVSLARAMVRRPDVYLMDEPLGTLDAEHRLELREFIRSQQLSLAVTAIYVTHDQEEAMSLADRIVVMADGGIRQIGTPSQVYNQPADLFVANFVGSPGMNLLNGHVGETTFSGKDTDERVSLSKPYKSAPAVLGIRPEFIYPSPAGLCTRVILSEYLGSHCYVHLDSAWGNLIMRTDSSNRFNTSETLFVQLDPSHICLFNPTTGSTLV